MWRIFALAQELKRRECIHSEKTDFKNIKDTIMKLVKLNPALNKPMNEIVDRFFNDGFRHDPFFKDALDRSFLNHSPSVNIVEGNDRFEIQVAAPGLSKKDFKLHLEKDLLTISAEVEEEKDTEDRKFRRREFSFGKFERAFRLPETVNREDISASYKNGVLAIGLPKLEEAKEKPARDIEIK